jgi:hypothetical protein
MENNVIQLEAGNLEADDSEIKQKYDNQKQLNIQLGTNHILRQHNFGLFLTHPPTLKVLNQHKYNTERQQN